MKTIQKFVLGVGVFAIFVIFICILALFISATQIVVYGTPTSTYTSTVIPKKFYTSTNTSTLTTVPTPFLLRLETATSTIEPTITKRPTVAPTVKVIKPTKTPKSQGQSYPIGVTALCKDGTYSYSQTASGTCSHHGGVKKWIHKP